MSVCSYVRTYVCVNRQERNAHPKKADVKLCEEAAADTHKALGVDCVHFVVRGDGDSGMRVGARVSVGASEWVEGECGGQCAGEGECRAEVRWLKARVRKGKISL